MPKRIPESVRQVRVLEALPKDGKRIRVSELVKKLKMSPRKVNDHLEKLAGKGMVDFEYFPGERAPIRLVWLTKSNIQMEDAEIMVTDKDRDWVPRARKPSTPLSQKRKIKNKVKELLN